MENRPHSSVDSTRFTRRALNHRSGDEFNPQEKDEEEAEVEELNEMAQKLLHYRSTFPDLLTSDFAAVIASQRPQFPVSDPNSQPGKFCEGVLAAVEDQETTNGVSLLKKKISTNVSTIPLVLKRMNECLSRVDKLSSCSGIIHPALKRVKRKANIVSLPNLR